MNIRPFEIADIDAVVRLWHDCDLVVPWNDPHKDIERKLRNTYKIRANARNFKL